MPGEKRKSNSFVIIANKNKTEDTCIVNKSKTEET
jgi:hypothetical protein